MKHPTLSVSLTKRKTNATIVLMRIAKVLSAYREQIARQWADRLHTKAGERYGERPIEELVALTGEAANANFAVLVNNDFSKIDSFIERITRIRLGSGFALSEVQKAFELYRTILLPIITEEMEGPELLHALQQMNYCLSYTITKFSDYFQSLHEQQIRDYAQNLEREVEERTSDLAESEAKHRALVGEINDGYFVNQKGVIVFANQAFCDMHGYSLQEVIGKQYLDLVAPESQVEVQRLYEQRIQWGDTKDLYVYLRRHKDGSILPTENKVKLMLYEGEYAAAGICRDITERTEMERRVREAEQLAHIGQLTTSLAHEIRNPLSSIKMNIQILLKNMLLDGNDKRRMEIMAHEISRLERILTEMLDFAKPLRLNLELASINAIADSCLEEMDAKIKEKGIRVKKRFSRKIPVTMVDHEKIEQAILNVLLNSVEVMADGGEIEIATKQDSRSGKFIRVEIADNGPGIGPDDLPYVFDPFFSNKKRGTGLGLSNVRKIVEAHHGAVKVTPREPGGIRLSFTVPVRERL